MSIEVEIEPILRTSDEWQRMSMETIVIDPDGWDRKNYQFSWFQEIITEEEYLKRRMRSTCIKDKD